MWIFDETLFSVICFHSSVASQTNQPKEAQLKDEVNQITSDVSDLSVSDRNGVGRPQC